MNIVIRVAGSAGELDPAAWDALDHGPSPFLRHGFLRALEDSGSIDAASSTVSARRRSGWTSVYLMAELGGRLVGAVVAFIKTHSYGEYIFDWGWASAADRAGIRYYPKLVIAAPNTPATGPRIMLAPDLGAPAANQIRAALIASVRAVAEDAECSSIHWLFCTAEEQALLAKAEFFPRASLQFHWRNRDYQTFDDFLGALKSRKRKQLLLLRGAEQPVDRGAIGTVGDRAHARKQRRYGLGRRVGREQDPGAGGGRGGRRDHELGVVAKACALGRVGPAPVEDVLAVAVILDERGDRTEELTSLFSEEVDRGPAGPLAARSCDRSRLLEGS